MCYFEQHADQNARAAGLNIYSLHTTYYRHSYLNCRLIILKTVSVPSVLLLKLAYVILQATLTAMEANVSLLLKKQAIKFRMSLTETKLKRCAQPVPDRMSTNQTSASKFVHRTGRKSHQPCTSYEVSLVETRKRDHRSES